MKKIRKPVSICLNMIVKNEAHVIERCLNSMKPLIDYWVIVDTGSTDGTQDHIRDIMADVPGELHERPWINFGHNRSEAMTLAKGKADFTFVIDADEFLEISEDIDLNLTSDAYMIIKRRNTLEYRVMSLVRSRLDWYWEGALHETLNCNDSYRSDQLDGVEIMTPREGARSLDPMIYKRDALMLEQALLDNPDSLRDTFYLAQSYRDCEEYDLSIRWYDKRACMGGWIEEIYMSRLNIARIRRDRKDPWPEVLAAYMAAIEVLPNRAEAIYDLGMLFSDRQDWNMALHFLRVAAGLKLDPGHILFIERDKYDWRSLLEAAVAAYYVGRHEDAVRMNRELLSRGTVPAHLIDRVEENLKLSLERIEGDHLALAS